MVTGTGIHVALFVYLKHLYIKINKIRLVCLYLAMLAFPLCVPFSHVKPTHNASYNALPSSQKSKPKLKQNHNPKHYCKK